MAGLLHASRWDEIAGPNGEDSADSFDAEVLFEKAATLHGPGPVCRVGRFASVQCSVSCRTTQARLNNLGTAIWRQGRVHEAEEHYRRALVHDPNDYAILNNLGNILWEQGRLDEAVQWFRPAVALRPDSPIVLMNLGVTLSDLGTFDEALGFIRDSLRLLPDCPESYVNLGNTLARQGKLDEALACYEHGPWPAPRFPGRAAVSRLSLAGSRRL